MPKHPPLLQVVKFRLSPVANAAAISSSHVIQNRLAARAHHRQQLIAQEKARLGSDRLSNADYERISNWMQAWEARRCS